MDKYCTYCSEAVTEAQRVLDGTAVGMPNTYVCDSDKCQRELAQEVRAIVEAREYRRRR